MFKEFQIADRLLTDEKLRRCILHQCRAACCLYGVWMDETEQSNVFRYWDEIRKFMPEAYRAKAEACFDERREPDEFLPSGQAVHSLVIEDKKHYGGTACVFLNSEHKCALQCASAAMGHHPWFLKPFYCILHPLDLDNVGHITLDDAALLADEPGSCLRPAEHGISLLVTFEEELRYFLGNDAYERLLK